MPKSRIRDQTEETGPSDPAIVSIALLEVAHAGLVRRIRVSLPGRANLQLNGLDLLSPGPFDPAQATVTMSSVSEGRSGEPAELFQGRPIRTRKDRKPFWEVTFAEPVSIAGIAIHNRQGKRAAQARGFVVQFEDEAGTVTTFRNLSQTAADARVAQMRQLGEALLAAAPDGAGGGAFMGAWMGLLHQARDVALGGAATPEALSAARIEAIEALLLFLHGLEGAALRQAIQVGAGLAMMLIQGGTPRRAAVTPPETRAFAVQATDMLLRRKDRKLSNGELRDFREYYDSEELIPVLEGEIAALYLAATGDAAALPFMVRVHGISGPVLQPRADDYLGTMEDLQAALERLGYGSMICYGTLLGAVREGGFIEHDDDADMAVVLRTADAPAEMAKVAEGLEALGFRCRLIRSSGLMRVTSPKRGVPVDLFPAAPTGDGSLAMFMERMRIRPVDGALVLPLGTVSFLGRVYGAPADPEGFLADRYGPGWRTPQRKIGHRTART